MPSGRSLGRSIARGKPIASRATFPATTRWPTGSPRPSRSFVAEAEGRILGTSHVGRNRPGPAAHVANASFATHPDARGRGVARALVGHAKDWARGQGFRAMQFNFVVSTNADAVHSWQKAGFAIVGRLPGAFLHPRHGYVDALVMFHDLTGAADDA